MKTAFKKIILITTGMVLLVVVGLIAYQVFSGSKTVDTGIAKLSRTYTGHTSNVWSVRFSPDGKWLASGSVDRTVIIRDRESGGILKTLKHPQGVTSIDLSPDGKRLVTASYDGKVRLWNIADGTLMKLFDGHNGTAWTVAFSPDGKTIAAAGEDKVILLWDLVSGKIIHRLPGHTLNIWVIKFSRNGQNLASGSFDNSVRIWDPHTGKLLKQVLGHTEAVVDIAYSHDGKLLATSSDDKTIRIWNTDDGSMVRKMEVREHVQAVTFSPDDKRLMTGGRDKAAGGELIQNFSGDSENFKGVSARLWDINTGKVIQTFATHRNDVNDVAYSEDGAWILTASADHSIQLWQVLK